MVVIILLAAGVVALSNMGTPTVNNTTEKNVTTNTSNVTGEIKIVANQSGPATAKKGDTITIKYSVSNKGGQTVYNVKAHSQDFETTVGTLKAGETKNYEHKLHIPTDEEVQADFGENATVENPFFIGGFGVTFTDAKGAKRSITANSIEIKLV